MLYLTTLKCNCWTLCETTKLARVSLHDFMLIISFYLISGTMKRGRRNQETLPVVDAPEKQKSLQSWRLHCHSKKRKSIIWTRHPWWDCPLLFWKSGAWSICVSILMIFFLIKSADGFKIFIEDDGSRIFNFLLFNLHSKFFQFVWYFISIALIILKKIYSGKCTNFQIPERRKVILELVVMQKSRTSGLHQRRSRFFLNLRPRIDWKSALKHFPTIPSTISGSKMCLFYRKCFFSIKKHRKTSQVFLLDIYYY